MDIVQVAYASGFVTDEHAASLPGVQRVEHEVLHCIDAVLERDEAHFGEGETAPILPLLAVDGRGTRVPRELCWICRLKQLALILQHQLHVLRAGGNDHWLPKQMRREYGPKPAPNNAKVGL